MKKKLILLAITILAPIVVITNASALTNDESVIVEEASQYFNSDYPYCSYYRRIAGNRDMNNIYCFSSLPIVSCSENSGYRCDFSNFGNNYLDIYIIHDSTNGNSKSSSIKTGSANYQYIDFTGYSYSHVYSNCSLFDSNNLVNFDSFDFGSSLEFYTITFNPPKDTTIVVKDSNNNEITPKSQYVYELEPGSYTYSASNNLYSSLNDIAFEVTSDNTINVEMTSRIENSNMRSIFSQYYSYISVLVSDIFNIDNPIFLFLISFIIGFSMIYLIKKLIGGFL